jgi:hypothetical protein
VDPTSGTTGAGDSFTVDLKANAVSNTRKTPASPGVKKHKK